MLTPEQKKYIDQLKEKGVAILDEKYPGWKEFITPTSLDMANPFHCVLGKLYGEYNNGTDRLGIVGHGSEFGFDLVITGDLPDHEITDDDDQIDYLNEIWEKELNAN